MPALSKNDKLRLLTTILESRHGDLREQNLNRQGKGHFHVPGWATRPSHAISFQMEPDDYIVPYYRDRALVLGRGVASSELALDYMAKRKGQSGGRQMPSHYSYADRHIWSVPTPTGSQLLPACGIAWGLKLDGKPNLVVTTVGDAATREGDFFEALCFAKEKGAVCSWWRQRLRHQQSDATHHSARARVLQPNDWIEIDGADVQAVYDVASKAIEGMRAGKGPSFLWVMMERLSSHTSSDDQKLYRSTGELQNLEKGDPLKRWKEQLIVEGVMTAEEYDALDNEIKERVRQEFAAAEREKDPSTDELNVEVTGEPPELTDEVLPPGKYRIGDTINKALRWARKDSGRIILAKTSKTRKAACSG